MGVRRVPVTEGERRGGQARSGVVQQGPDLAQPGPAEPAVDARLAAPAFQRGEIGQPRLGSRHAQRDIAAARCVLAQVERHAEAGETGRQRGRRQQRDGRGALGVGLDEQPVAGEDEHGRRVVREQAREQAGLGSPLGATVDR